MLVIFHERRRKPRSEPGSPVRARGRQGSIAFWTIGRFYQSLQQFDDYCDRLDLPDGWYEGNDPSKPTREDLLRFAESVLLTAATQVIPFSQGKANLFHFVDDPTDHSREIASQLFTGPFPPAQVLSRTTTYRRITVSRDGVMPSVAGECIRYGAPRMAPLETGPFSDVERKLGTTHILGMPADRAVLKIDDYCQIPCGWPAAITVDLRIVLARPFMYMIRRFTYRRGLFVCHRLARYSHLIAPEDEGGQKVGAP